MKSGEAIVEVMKACRDVALSQQAIQAATGVSRSSVQRMVDLLCDQGVLEKRIAEDDRALFVYAVSKNWGGNA
jgi:DNA-binding MarR family transcriptional regulator